LDSNEESSAKITFVIKQEIYRVFGYDVPIIVISKADLEACFSNCNFLKENEIDTKKLYVAFVSKELKQENINDLKMSQFKPDEVQIDKTRIFIKYYIGAGKTRLDQKYIEKKLNLTATIRNWNTVSQLLNMYEER
jgi:uncharacterized protein (DUF1697 family)